MKKIIWLLLLITWVTSCEKNDFEITDSADEYFFLRNDGADMPVWVKGNTKSGVFILVLHGGPGSGSVGTFDVVKSFKILQKDYAVIYWDQRGAGATQGHYSPESINAAQMVEDLEKLVILIKNKYGNDISLFLQGGSWGGYLGLAYLIKENNQNNIKGFIDESGAHNISLTGNAERRMLMKYATGFIHRDIKKDKWQKILDWCETVDSITTTAHFNTINRYAFDGTNLIADSVAEDNFDEGELIKAYLLGPLSAGQAKANQKQTEDSPLTKNFIELNLSPSLHKVTIPTLMTGGKYDLIVPNEVIEEAYRKISSENKEIIIFNKSGHSPSSSEPEEFANALIGFIEKYK